MKIFFNLWHEPIVHFLLIGVGLFLLFGMTSQPGGDTEKKIIVTRDQIEQLSAKFNRTWMRQPDPDEMAALINDHVRTEVYYREALSLGLDQNDPLIQRRMRQKMEFILEDLTAEEPPEDDVLSKHIQTHPDRFAFESLTSFRQIYLNPENHTKMEEDAATILRDLRGGANPDELGDATMIRREFVKASESEVARSFGKQFVQQLAPLTTGVWTGPIFSGLGVHLVLVIARTEGRLPELEEIREKVARDYMTQRRKELKDISYKKLLEQYEVVIQALEDVNGKHGKMASAKQQTQVAQ